MKNVNWLANRYELTRIMGAGSLGTVYHAIDHLKHQMIALKLVDDAANTNGSSTTNNRALTLAHEFQILASLRHPHIISVLDYGFDAEGRPFYTMELLHQADNVLHYGQSQPVERRIDLILQMLQALAYLHQRGIIHRDIKPANALVDGRGHLRMLDFGLAVLHKRDVGVGVVGTLKYIAPELLQGGEVSQAADLYAVGVIAYELLTGRYPYRAGNANQLVDEVINHKPDFAPLRLLSRHDSGEAVAHTQTTPVETLDQTIHLEDDVPAITPSPRYRPAEHTVLDYDEHLDDEQLIQVISRLLAKDPQVRYQSASAVIRDLSLAIGRDLPPETHAIRESFLQAAAFVGRDDEVKRLNDALHNALSGRGSSWLVIGESGIGKSRLLEEIRVRALVKGAIVLVGNRDTSSHTPFDIWCDPLRQLILSMPLRSSEISILSEIIPRIDQLTGQRVMPLPSTDDKHRHARLVRTIVRLFQRQVQPVVLLLEDLQEGDVNLEPLRLLTEQIQQYPLLIIGSYCYDAQPEISTALSGMNTLLLQRFEQPQIAELSASMLGETVGTQPEVVAMLQRETEGNVSFMIEVLRVLAEEAGRLSQIGQAELPRRVMSRSLQEIMAQRINRLEPTVLPLLKAAAVMGRRLDTPILQALMPEIALDDWLVMCSNAAILDVYEDTWQFTHDKLRLYLVDSLSLEEKQQLHQLIAQTIEQVYADDLDAQLYRLMIHWHHASNLDKEWHYTQLASREKLAITSFDYAQNLYERAVELAENIDQPPPLVEQAVLYQHLADACALTCIDNQAEQYYQKALSLYQRVNDQRGMARVMLGLGKLAYNISHDCNKALAYFENSLQHCWMMDDQHGAATALDYIGRCWMSKGEYASAHDYLEQSLTLAESVQDVSRMAHAQLHLGMNARFRGDYHAARQHLENSVTTYESIEDVAGVSTALTHLANIYITQQEIDVGWHFAYHALRLALDNELVAQSVHTLVNFALLKLNGHEVRTALEWVSVLCHHPAYEHSMYRDTQLIQHWASAELLPIEYETIWVRGQQRDYQEVINEILQQHIQAQMLQ